MRMAPITSSPPLLFDLTILSEMEHEEHSVTTDAISTAQGHMAKPRPQVGRVC